VRALADPRPVQEALLARALRANARTRFGREHDFEGIRSLAAFGARVPARDAEAFRPYLEAVARGEPGVLTRERVRRLQPTGGSTAGCKWIPYTDSLQREFGRGIAAWIADLFGTDPALRGGPAYWSVTPAARAEERLRGPIPSGFEEDTDYLGGMLAPLVASTLAVPQQVRRLTDLDAFRRATLVHLLRARDLRMISVWHPTFLTLLIEAMRARWDELLDALARGLETGHAALDTPPDPRRATELAALGPAAPERLWPRLALISAWGDGPAAVHVGALRRLFPGVAFQPKGLLATEAFVSIPFRGRHPLAVTSHVLEFEDAEARAHPAWRLEPGGRYSVLVTTGGGLYRYRLGDRVEVTGLLEGTPCIRFLGKEDRVSDRAGEKLDEAFVAEAIHGALEQCGLEASFTLLAPEAGAHGTGYVLFISAARAAPPDLASVVERSLRANPQYAWAVDLGQLLPVSICEVGAAAPARYVERLRERGARLGDVKPAAMSPLDGWREVLGGVARPAASAREARPVAHGHG
jgi:hypothetical protein